MTRRQPSPRARTIAVAASLDVPAVAWLAGALALAAAAAALLR